MNFPRKIFLFLLSAVFILGVPSWAVASESELCSTTSTPCNAPYGVGTIVDFSLKSGSSASLMNTGTTETLLTCTGLTEKYKITVQGGHGVTGAAHREPSDPTGCTFPAKITVPGRIKISQISGTENGTVIADAEIAMTVNTVFFGSCVYGVKAGTKLGTITGGNPAKLTVNAVTSKLSGSAFACPETSEWVASEEGTSPTPLYVEP